MFIVSSILCVLYGYLYTVSVYSERERAYQHLFGVVQDWYKSVFWIEVPEHYPLPNGGQN